MDLVFHLLKYNPLRYSMMWWGQVQNTHQTLNSQWTPHVSPSPARYGMSFVSIIKKMTRYVKTTLYTAISVIQIATHLTIREL